MLKERVIRNINFSSPVQGRRCVCSINRRQITTCSSSRNNKNQKDKSKQTNAIPRRIGFLTFFALPFLVLKNSQTAETEEILPGPNGMENAVEKIRGYTSETPTIAACLVAVVTGFLIRKTKLELNEKKKALNSLESELKCSSELLTSREKEKEELNERLSQSESNLKEASRMIEEFEREKQKLESEVKRLEISLADVKKQMNKLQEDLTKEQSELFKEKEKELKEIEESMNEMVLNLTRVEVELQTTNVNLKETNDLKEKYYNEMNELKDKVFVLEGNLEVELKKVDVLEKTSQNAVEKLKEALSEKRDLEFELEEVQAKNISLEDGLLNLKEKSTVVGDELSNMSQEFLKAKASYQSKKKECEKLVKKHEELLELNSKLHTNFSVEQRSNKELRDEISRQSEDADNLNAEIYKMKMEIKRLKDSYYEAEEKLKIYENNEKVFKEALDIIDMDDDLKDRLYIKKVKILKEIQAEDSDDLMEHIQSIRHESLKNKGEKEKVKELEKSLSKAEENVKKFESESIRLNNLVINYQTHLSLLEEKKKSDELQEQNSFKLAIDNIVSKPHQSANGHSSPSLSSNTTTSTTLVDPITTNDTTTEVPTARDEATSLVQAIDDLVGEKAEDLNVSKQSSSNESVINVDNAVKDDVNSKNSDVKSVESPPSPPPSDGDSAMRDVILDSLKNRIIYKVKDKPDNNKKEDIEVKKVDADIMNEDFEIDI